MAGPQKQLSPSSKNIVQLFQADFFAVSVNQRPYTWKPKNHERLWRDFLSALEESKTATANPIGHFLGPIYLVGPTDSDADNRLQIIDGQQRITTLSCMASLLIEFTDQHSEKQKIDSMRTKLQNILYDSISLKRVPRLQLHRIQNFYESVVVDTFLHEDRRKKFEKESAPSCKPLKAALNFYYEELLAHLKKFPTPAEYDSEVENIFITLTEQFYVLSVIATNDKVIYKLFETLNERGLDLSQADLIKNALYKSAKDSSQCA